MGFAGPIGAGKTTGAQHLQKSHGFDYVRYSQILAEWRAKDPNSKSALQELGWDVMASGLQEELNQRVIGRIAASVSTAVDGLRHPIDFEMLKAEYGTRFTLVYVDAPPELRWRRTRAMGRFKTPEEFVAADQHEVEQPLRGLLTEADVALENDTTLGDYIGSLDRIVAAIEGGGDR